MKKHQLITAFVIAGSCVLLTFMVGWTAKNSNPPIDQKTIEASVSRGFGLLQTSGATFISKVRCASCHHTSMTSMVAEVMSKKGITGVDTTAKLREMAELGTLDFVGNPNLNNQFVPAKFLIPYTLLGLAGEQHQADFSTDISVNFIISQALADGHFNAEYSRVPLEYGDIHLTALCARVIDLYAPQKNSLPVQSLLARSKSWLEKQVTTDQQELAFQLLGLQWCGSDQTKKLNLAKQLIKMQNKDGGWSQLPTMQSDAYATGQSLYALLESAVIDKNDPACQQAIDYLIRTQDKTGAWIVKTRSNPIQPFVNSDFPPYDDNQFISSAASNWATLALATSLPDKK